MRPPLANPIARFQDWVEVRWPRASSLRLQYVIAWVVLGSAAALLIAWFGRGSLSNPLDTYQYMASWLFASIFTCIAWVFIQWKERPALPAQRPLGLIWSPAVAGLIVTALLAPTFVAGFAADRYVARLDETAASRDLWPHAVGMLHPDGEEPLMPWWCRELDDPRKSAWAPFFPETPLKKLEALPTEQRCVVPGPDGKPQSTSVAVELMDRAAANVHIVALAAGFERYRNRLAGTTEPVPQPSRDPGWAISAIWLALALGATAGLAGVFRLRAVALTASIVWIVGAVVQALTPMLLMTSVGRPVAIHNTIEFGGGSLYLALVFVLVLRCLYRRERTRWTDVLAMISVIGPAFIVATQYFVYPDAFTIVWVTKAVHGQLWIGDFWIDRYMAEVYIAWLGLVIILSPLLSAYRALPQAR